MHDTTDARENHLLACLPEAVWQRLAPSFERVTLQARAPLYEAGQVLSYAYFPAGAMVSLMVMSESGASSESALVGHDGMVGLTVLLGGESTCSRAVVQVGGDAYRIPAQALKQEFDRAGPAMQVLLRYMQALLTHTAQTAICNRHHSVLQQFARSLLQSLDRQQGAEVFTTHEALAERLGVRREGVTGSAIRLQKQGVIRYSRGHISVVDRVGLERQACECYAVVKRECRRLLPRPPAFAELMASGRLEPLAA
jgi:CRP-like cAMP-binding protein